MSMETHPIQMIAVSVRPKRNLEEKLEDARPEKLLGQVNVIKSNLKCQIY